MLNTEKAINIECKLKALRRKGNDTLTQIASVISKKVEFYDQCICSWKKPDVSQKWRAAEIDTGIKCGNAGLDMAGSIVNELETLYLAE